MLEKTKTPFQQWGTELLSFLIRTLTVGMGLSPIQQNARGLYRRCGISPTPKERYSATTEQLFHINKKGRTRRPFSIIFSIILNYARISATTPEPTVLPPSRIAKRRPFSIAIAEMSSTVISTLSPGRHISTPSGRLITPVTSVVLK